MVLTLASLALTCLTSADLVPQEPKTILSASEIKSLNKKAKKWYDNWRDWDNAVGKRRSKTANARRKSRDAFRKEWDKKSESQGDLLASVEDVRQIFSNCFPYSRVSGLSGTVKQVKGGDGPSHYHRVPKTYRPDTPIRTIVMRDGKVEVQAGAGIVADSVPSREYDETNQKAAAALQAIAWAERAGRLRQ